MVKKPAKIVLVATAVTAAVAVGAAGAKAPAFHPNSTADLEKAVKELSQFSAYLSEMVTDSDGAPWRCTRLDDAPTKKSLKHSVVIQYCVKVTATKKAKTAQEAT